MIKIPQVFFWKFYSCGKLTCTKTFCFVISTKECICNTQFYGLVTPTTHSSVLSLKKPKRTTLLWKKSSPTHESPFNFKNWSGKSDEFGKLVGEKWLNFSPTKIFPNFFFSNKVINLSLIWKKIACRFQKRQPFWLPYIRFKSYGPKYPFLIKTPKNCTKNWRQKRHGLNFN